MRLLRITFAALFVAGTFAACDDDHDNHPPAENTGSACTAPDQCYPGLDGGTLKGEVECLTKVPGGYCTHRCASDTDCCAVTGECKSGFKQVCAPLTNETITRCFLSCEDADVKAADPAYASDTNGYCAKYANAAFGCRSTGGGSANRKVCLPN
ncbi:MAG: hypothetical protein HYV09_02275 [Deltaproteobacteria bacterium]|nr:hypothetical protein [Deltaproteobacteria bacterium]